MAPSRASVRRVALARRIVAGLTTAAALFVACANEPAVPVARRCAPAEEDCVDADGDAYATCDASDAAGTCDCDERDTTIHPDAPELCHDGIDQDCATARTRRAVIAMATASPRVPRVTCPGPVAGL